MEKSGAYPGATNHESGTTPKTKSLQDKCSRIITGIFMLCYRLRKFVLAAPVVYVALKLAAYNMEHLPEQVGLNLQSTGEFTMTIARSMAVIGPAGLTGACLLLMLCSRKALYPWAISVFTLALPVLLLVSNVYPA